jgi:hypothetical protein
MPNPLRPGAPRTTGPVTSPVTSPAAPSTPAVPTTPARPGDVFGAPVGGSNVVARLLPAPVAMGELEGTALSIGRDGRITSADDKGTLDDTIRINRLALKGADTANPFAKVNDKLALLEVGTRLATQHQAGLMDPGSDKQVLDLRTVRAGSLALLQQAAERAGELGDAGLQKQLLGKLTAALAKEPFRALKDFSYEALVSAAAAGKLPDVKEAREAVYPSAPPREKWLKDGMLKIAYYIDNDGSKLDYQLGFLRSMGFQEQKHDDENYTFTRPARGGQPKIEVQFKSPKTHDDKPKLLEKIDDPTVDIIAYTGHAGYGHRVDHAIGQGAKSLGDDKLVVLMQCYGEGNVESLERAFPDAQVISTTEPSTDNHDQLMFHKLLNGVLQGKDYATIQKETVAGLKTLRFLGDANPDKHFFFPNSREVLVGKYDRDKDGTRDAGDKVFNVIYPKRLDAAGGFDPVAQAIADDALDGSHLNKASENLGLVMRYNNLLEPALAAKVKWSAEAPRPAGFFTPADGDLKAFQFSIDQQNGKLNVALSTRFAHTDGKDLSRMLAYEAGLYLGKEAGLDAKGQVSLALTMLERAAHQQDGWYYSNNLTDEPWAEETLLARRYGLEGVSMAEISEAMGHADDLTASHVGMVKTLVESRNLAAAATAAPKTVGEALTVPGDLRLGASSVDASAVTRVLREMGVNGNVEAFGPKYLSSGEPNNLIAVVRDPGGKTQQIGLSLDNEGYVRLASRIPLDVDAVKVRAGREYMGAVAKAVPGLNAAKLTSAYDLELRSGKSVPEAAAAVLAGERRNVPLGTDIPRLEIFEKLRSYGLATEGEASPIQDVLARVYPTGMALRGEEKALAWLDKAAGAQASGLRQLWLEGMASDGTRLGAGKALVNVLNALPTPLPLANELPLRELLDSGLIARGGQADFLKALQARTGDSPVQFARRYGDAFTPDWSTEVQTKLLTEGNALVAANASPKDLLIKFAEVMKQGNVNPPPYDTALLEEAGLLSSTDAAAVARRLEELKAP